jgi:O-antigen/teichoic acid export membrane protein
VVLLLVLSQGSVFFLAWGYLISSLIGVSLYGVMLWRLVRSQDLLRHFSIRSIDVPWKPVLAFTVPLLVSDLVYVVMNSVSVVLLEHYRGVTEVAPLRAQAHVAGMSQLVMASFATLFTPAASRMFARGDGEAVNALYWQTAIWIAVCSFPAFVLTCSLARPVSTLILGERYESSAAILALLGFGYYFNAALGFNGLVLKIHGRVYYIVAIGLLTVAISLALNLALIPEYGALGAAIGMAVAMVCHNALKQAGLLFGTGISLFESRYLRVYVVIGGAAVALFAVQWATALPPQLTLVLAALASWVVFRSNRRLLEIGRTFPEAARIPLVRRVLGL